MWMVVTGLLLNGLGPTFALGPLGPDSPMLLSESDLELATNGTDYLAVWTDMRFGPTGQVFAARIRGSDGQLLDPENILVGPAPGRTPHAVALSGVGYAIVWDSNFNTYLRILNDDGTWDSQSGSDFHPLFISGGGCPVVSTNSAQIFVAFTDGSERLVRLTRSGALLDAPALTLDSTASYCPRIGPAVGGDVLVMWPDVAGVAWNAVALSPAAPAASAQLITSPDSFAMQQIIASPSGGWFAAWTHQNAGINRLEGAQIITVAAPVVTIATDDGGANILSMSAAPSGDIVVVSTNQYHEPTAAFELLLPDAGITAPLQLPFGSESAISLATSSTGMMLGASSYGGITVAPLSTSGVAGASVNPVGSAGSQLNASVATNGSEYLVAWIQQNGALQEIMALRVGLTGSLLDAAPISLSAGDTATTVDSVAAMSALGQLAVGWHRTTPGDDFAIRMLTPGGTWAPAVHAEGPNNTWHDGMTFSDGLSYFVIAKDGVNYDLYVSRVDFDGGVSTPQLICSAPDYQHFPSAAPLADGGLFVTWLDNRTGADLYAARVGADGVPLDANCGFPVIVGQSSDAPQVASDGAGGFTLVWSNGYGLNANHIVGTTVGPTQPFAPSGYPWQLDGAHVLTVAGGTLVTWADPQTSDVKAQVLAPWGAALDAGLVQPISSGAAVARSPAAAGQGNLLWVYGEQQPVSNALALRARIFTGDPFGTSCSDSWTCASGLCLADACTAPAHDAGPSDAGAGDAGSPDAGAVDAGTADAGATDAGTTDAGRSDAGVSGTDAGQSSPDGGATAPRYGLGCGCRDIGAAPMWLAMLAWVGLRRRRR